jgi:DNA polymerase-3 subunit chi
VEALNGLLWTYRDESFLPHGGPGDGFEAAQPIYLTAGEETPNGADVLFLVDGASEQVTAMSAYQRVVLMFDGHDPTAVEAARSVWRSVTAAEMKALYWAQEGGRWVKKAESAAPSA